MKDLKDLNEEMVSLLVTAITEPKWRWLESTEKLQREAYGIDWKGRRYPKAQVLALRDNLLAAIVELAGEVPREFAWKPWAHDEPWVNHEHMLSEIVDVMHFLGNMLLTLGVTDDEFWEAYRRKQEINRDRQTKGYKVQR